METIRVQTKKRIEMIDITSEIQNYVTKNNIESGLLFLFVPHTTAAITINEGADPDVQHDITEFLNQMIPIKASFHHSEGNSDAHIKASLIGPSEIINIEQGKITLGTWQHIFFCESDGPRTRTLWIKALI